jgi:hypothetical protein
LAQLTIKGGTATYSLQPTLDDRLDDEARNLIAQYRLKGSIAVFPLQVINTAPLGALMIAFDSHLHENPIHLDLELKGDLNRLVYLLSLRDALLATNIGDHYAALTIAVLNHLRPISTPSESLSSY